MTAITLAEVNRLHEVWRDAESAFEEAYRADVNRKGMRGGDFRYRSDLHSPATRTAAQAFTVAGDAAKKAFREFLAQPEVTA